MSISFGKWVLGLDRGHLPGKDLIGAKAWSIGHMSRLGLNVPPAFVVTTDACRGYLSDEAGLTGIQDEIAAGIAWLETLTGRTFGGGPHPLLVSVRSGAAISMPGMMDTVLNVGINETTEPLLAREFNDTVFARDTHRRFLDAYSRLVLDAPPISVTEEENPSGWREALAKAGAPVPDSAWEQLSATMRAVFLSWNSRRAQRYRSHHGIPNDAGTAVVVQAMVFGNRDVKSGTGVLFSRNPLTGAPIPYGEFLPQAQGEDIVSGRATPQPLESMREKLGTALDQLLAAAQLLERANGDLQDIEFTVESGELYLLQSRVGKRAPEAAARIAVDMVAEGFISPGVALLRVSPEQIMSRLSPHLANGTAVEGKVLCRGEAASPGVGWGVVVTDPDEAERRASVGENVVLARVTTSPDDLHGMIAARAIITECGGSTSHAAVVSRALGRPCVVGCGDGVVAMLRERRVTVDGGSGAVYAGKLPVATPDEDDDPVLRRLVKWAAAATPIKVQTDCERATVSIDTDSLSISDLDDLRKALAESPPGATVRGRLFARNSQAVAAAIEAGVSIIVTTPRLPALLAAIDASDAFSEPRH